MSTYDDYKLDNGEDINPEVSYELSHALDCIEGDLRLRAACNHAEVMLGGTFESDAFETVMGDDGVTICSTVYLSWPTEDPMGDKHVLECAARLIDLGHYLQREYYGGEPPVEREPEIIPSAGAVDWLIMAGTGLGGAWITYLMLTFFV